MNKKKNNNPVAMMESQDQGKTLTQAKTMEMPRCVANLRYFANLILNHHETATVMDAPGKEAITITHREPIGVVGIIGPWNLPLYLLTWKIAPALAMGNCVVAKPSELTSFTAHAMAGLLEKAGFPPGVMNIVFGYGKSAGEPLVVHPKVGALSFTGGTITGRRIASLAGALGRRVSLELGGKNPAIIFADADMEAAIQSCVRSSFSNQGEICLCTSRIYVESSCYEEFTEKFVEASSKLIVGNPLDEKTTVGAVISKEHQEKIMSYIKLAREENGKILLGGDSLTIKGLEKGFFVAPTIIADIKQTSRLTQEEIFGPVTCIYPFNDDNDAIILANDVEYGLAASVFSKNGQRAQNVARRLKAGVIWINAWMIRDLASPFGGLKASGHGKEGGIHSLDFVSDIKTISVSL